MTARTKLRDLINQLSAEWLDPQPAKLGDGTGSDGGIVLTATPGVYNARLINGKAIHVYNQANVPPIPDLDILVGRRKSQPGIWQIIGEREVYTQPTARDQIKYHHAQHEEGGGDQLFLDRKQINQLAVRVFDAANFIVKVLGAVVPTATGIKEIANQNIDLSSYVVTSGAKIITIESDDDGVLTVNEGTPFGAPAVATAADIPVPASGQYPFMGILFYESQSELADADIFPIVPLPGSGGGTFDMAAAIHAASASAISDDDEFGFWENVSGLLKKITWANVIATLTTAFNALYMSISADYSTISANDADTDVTGAELEELSDGSETTLHSHAGGGGDKYPWEARLTLETGVPFSVTPQTAKTALYLTNYGGDQLAFFDGANWATIALGADISIKTTDAQTGTTTSGNKIISGLTDTSQLVVGMLITGTGVGAASVIATIDSPTQVTGTVNSTGSGTNTITFKCPASTVYDVFAFNDGGTAKLELVAGVVTRTTQNGVDVKTGDTTRRLVGTILTTATAGQLEVSAAYVSVSNRYNLLTHPLYICPGYNDNNAQTTYTITSTTWVQANGAAKINFALCKPQSIMWEESVFGLPVAGGYGGMGIGINTITQPKKTFFTAISTQTTTTITDDNGAPLPAGANYAALLLVYTTASPFTIWADFARIGGLSADGAGTTLSGILLM